MRRISFFMLLLLLFPVFSAGSEEVKMFEAPKQIVITFTGDCTIGCDPRERGLATGFEAYIEKYGYEYPFAKVKDIFEKDDLTVINLEGTFYNHDANMAADKHYHFRGPTDYARILPLASIEAASLGNNHILDYGKTGQDSTIEALEGQQVAWFGSNAYMNGAYIYEKDGVKIGFVSMYVSDWVQSFSFLNESLENLRNQHCSLIIGCVHGGVEYDVRYDKGGGQERLADAMIKNGADIIVCNHPHTVQGIRVQDGRTTLWSLGNFCFGGNSKINLNKMNEPCYPCYIAQFTFSFDEAGKYLGHQLNIIPCHVSGSKEFNDYQPHPVTGAEADAVISAIKRDLTPRKLTIRPYVEGVGALQDFVPAPAAR